MHIGFIRGLHALFLLLVLSACSKPPYSNLDNDQLQSMLDQGVPLYDIRRPDEWRQTGIVNGSKLLTFADGGGRVLPNFLPQFAQAVSKDEAVILICATGSRTNSLARYLIKELGYTKVYNVRHGISRWIREGRPVNRTY